MVGVLVNVVAIVVGGLIGLLLKHGINDAVKKVVMQGIGLSVIVIGLMNAIITENVLLMILSMVLGGTIGALLKIEARLDKVGQTIEQKFAQEEGGFAKGFVMATLIYCVGTLAIMGSIQAGVDGDNTTLFVKSMLDGITAIVFTATLGYGVIFSSIPVLLYQGGIVLLAAQVAPFMTGPMKTEMIAVGGLVVMGIGINILEIKQIKVGDLLPAIFIPVIYYLLVEIIPFL